MRSLRPDHNTGRNFFCRVESVSRAPFALSHRLILSGVLAVTGSAFFIGAYPPWNLGLVTGWLALVPLIAAVAGAPPMWATMHGWLFGFVANLGVFAWLLAVPGLRWYHFLLLDAYLAVYPALWCMMVARFVRGPALAQLGGACAWVLMDYVRAHAGFLALPWITLAQSQIDNAPLLQAAALFGEPAVTFLVVLGNLAIWNLVSDGRVRCAWLCVLPVLGTMTLGAYLLTHSRTAHEPTIRVAALGTDFPAHSSPTPDLQKRLDARIEFSQNDLPSGVEMIVWPESALVNPRQFPAQIDRLQQLVRKHQVTLVAGVAEATKFDHTPDESPTSAPKLRSGAWLITPNGEVPQHYEKSRLVPFAERVPLKGWFTWPVWLIPPVPEVARGPAPRAYPVPGGVRVGIMICWESLFAEHARALIHDGATMLLMLANEGWFGATAAGAQHNLTARMRAAETHRSVVVASNMGPPLVIDQFGQVIASSSPTSGMRWATAAVPIVTGRTLYSRLGDVFVLGCGVFILAVAVAARPRIRGI